MARIPPPKPPLRHGHTTTSPHSTPTSRPPGPSPSHTPTSTFSSRLLPRKATSLRGSRVDKYRDFFDAPHMHSHASSCTWNASYRSTHCPSRAWPQKLWSQASPLPPSRHHLAAEHRLHGQRAKGHETKHKTRRHGVGDHTQRTSTLPTTWLLNFLGTAEQEVDQPGASEHRGQTGKRGKRENPCPGQACRE